MKRIFTLLVFFGILLFSQSVEASFVDQLEDADGWDNHNSGNWTENANVGTYQAHGIYANSGSTYSGSRKIGFNDVGDWLELPPVDYPQTLKYYARLSSSGTASSNKLMIQVYNSSSSSWDDVVEHSCGSTSYSQYSADISAYVTQTNVRFRFYRTADNKSHYIDDIEIVTSSSNDTDSDVDGPALGSQPDPVLISSLTDTEPEAVRVFDFDVWDYGSPGDGLSTKITQVKIKAGSNNDVDWSTNIAGVKLSTDGGTSFVTIGTPIISASDITIPITSGNLDVPNGNAVTVSLLIYLKTSGLTDNGTLEFMVDDPDHGFTADASGSQFATTFPGATSNEILIDVDATELRFVQQPSDTEVNQTMSPAVTVEATDENGNRDLDFASDIAITSTGTLSGSPVTSTASSGLATFSSLVHTATGTGLTLNAERDGSGDWDVTSNTFDITAACTNATANINEFHYDNVGDDTNEFVEIYIEDPQPSTLSDYTVELYNGNGGGSYDNETLDNFTATAGTGGTYYVWDLPQNGIQNGPDGIALGGPCGLMEFLSYEDTFQATDGIADGQTSTDVGVEETSSTPENSSIQLVGGSWVVTDGANTKGAENSSTQPLELLDLSVTKINNSTLISWITSSELNNDYFSLEWSRDGRNFKEIAQIKSKGNHRENQEYGFTHRNPALGTNYYRLTQYDLDGRSETFNIVSVTFDFDKQDMIIAPNKVNNNLIIEFSKPVENGSLLIYDMEGQMIKNSILAKGIDMINLDVSGLPSGQYIVKYLDVKGTATKKFVKM